MKKSELLLTGLIFLGLVLGVLVGQFILFESGADAATRADNVSTWLAIGDFIFIRPLKLLILPVVFISVIAGVTAIGNPQRLGLLGLSTVAYYITTMMLAIIVGLTLVRWIEPGAGGSAEALLQESGELPEATRVSLEEGAATNLWAVIQNLGERLVPTNPIQAAYDGNTLGVVFFAILVGLALVSAGKVAEPAIKVVQGLFEALIKLVIWIIWLAPLAVFLLVAGRVGEVGLGNLAGPVGKYMLVVIFGLLFHATVTLPLIAFLFGRTNPYRFMWQMRKPIILAFSTASSAATMPITIEEAQRRGGCSERATNFVVPLGATVNMDGTALYQAVAVVFLFQIFGTDLSLGDQLVILLTATFAAIGAAGVPSAGLITMAIVITAVNSSLVAIDQADAVLPLSAVAIILGIDRILDMCRTAVNVWGDAIGARIMTRLAPDEDVGEEPGQPAKAT
jgi:Na+/H+-dicarboxylate symporter